MTEPKILLFRGRGIISKMIQWQCRSEYSHAAILMPDGRIVESWQGDGVRCKRMKSWDGVTAFSVPMATDDDWAAVIEFAKSKVGERYDYKSVLQFVSRRKADDNNRWFCSELVFAAFQNAGIDLLARVSAANVSPGDLCLSPYLIEED